MKPLRLAVVSTVVPPAESGQAKALERLLIGNTDFNIEFLSDSAPHEEQVGETSPRYFRLAPPVFNLVDGRLGRLWPSLNNELGLRLTIRRRAREIEKLLERHRVDVIVGCSGNPFDLAASAIAAQSLRTPFAAYLFDDPVFQWPPGLYRDLARKTEGQWTKTAKTVICANEALAQVVGARNRRLAMRVVMNPIEDSLYAVAPDQTHKCGEVTKIVYSGSVYSAQADALCNLVAAMAMSPGRFHLHIYSSQSRDAIASLGVSGPDVTCHSHVTAQTIANIQREADLLFLPLAFKSPIQEVITTSAPGKLGEYLAAGRPILVHAPADSFVTEFFRKSEAGVIVDQDDAGALHHHLQAMIQDSDLCRRLSRRSREVASIFSQSAARVALLRCFQFGQGNA